MLTYRHHSARVAIPRLGLTLAMTLLQMMVGVVWTVEMLGIAWLVAEIVLKSVAVRLLVTPSPCEAPNLLVHLCTPCS